MQIKINIWKYLIMYLKKFKEKRLIDEFGKEWTRFDQSKLSSYEHNVLFGNYFKILPKNFFKSKLICADLGGGSGRWSEIIIKKVKKLFFVEPSLQAINVAKKKLNKFKNVTFINDKIENLKIKDNFLDFAFSLGVLHHTNNYLKAIKLIRKKIKIKGFFLIYLYYNFENRPIFYFYLWYLSNILRKIISLFPFNLKKFICDLIAIFIYYPVAKFSKLLDYLKINSMNMPLSFYKNASLYTMRTDSLDRFATTIEKRFSKVQIKKILINFGFYNIRFSNSAPYWCVLCQRKN